MAFTGLQLGLPADTCTCIAVLGSDDNFNSMQTLKLFDVSTFAV
jgi:hypothetical protein